MSALVGFTANQATGTSGTITATRTITATNGVFIVCGYDSAGGVLTPTCSGSIAGACTALDTPNDTTNNQGYATFFKLNHPGGSDTFTITYGSSRDFRVVAVIEVSGVATTGSLLGHIGNFQATPTTATDALTSTNMSPTSANGILVALSVDNTNAAAPAAGTGFSTTNGGSVWTGTSTVAGLIESKGIASTSAVAGTFTAANNVGHITVAAIFANAIPGAANVILQPKALGVGPGSVRLPPLPQLGRGALTPSPVILTANTGTASITLGDVTTTAAGNMPSITMMAETRPAVLGFPAAVVPPGYQRLGVGILTPSALGNSGQASITLGDITATATGNMPSVVNVPAPQPFARGYPAAVRPPPPARLGAGLLSQVAPNIGATASITLDAITSTAASTIAIAGTASITLGSITTTATGTIALTGTETTTLGDVTTTATGALAIAGTATITLGDVTATATAMIINLARAAVAPMRARGYPAAVPMPLPPMIGRGLLIGGLQPGTGVSSITLGDITSTATGAVAIAASSSVTLGTITTTATGVAAIAATASVTLGAITSTASSVIAIASTASITLGVITTTATGVGNNSGTATITLGSITTSATAGVANTGTASITLGTITTTATGIGPVSASVGATSTAAVRNLHYSTDEVSQ